LRAALFAAVAAEMPADVPATDKVAANGHGAVPPTRTITRARRAKPVQDSTAVH
jgi:hypothetical protein